MNFIQQNIGLILIIVVFVACFIGERFRPLRQWTKPRWPRIVTNISVGVLSAVLVRILFYSFVLKTAAWTANRHWGLLAFLPQTPLHRGVLGFLLLDYTLFIWHWGNHQIPFLWRFHNVHHVDLDLDVSTSSRFHVGELSLATFFRVLQILVIGIDPVTLFIFDTLVWPATEFHHSNLRLPIRLERWLNKIIVTPRMHGIHHSIIQNETNSNFSTIFSFWDRLHRTLRLNVPQQDIVIGVPAYRAPDEIQFFQSLILPFRHQRPWQTSDGSHPKDRSSPEHQPFRLLS